MNSLGDESVKEQAHRLARKSCGCDCEEIPFGCEWRGYRILNAMNQAKEQERKKQEAKDRRDSKARHRQELENQSKARSRSYVKQEGFDE